MIDSSPSWSRRNEERRGRGMSDTDLLDLGMVNDLITSTGVADARGLLQVLRREAVRRLLTLRALACTERAAIGFELHTLEGSAGMLGLSRFCALLRGLRGELPDVTAERYARAIAELDAVLTASVEAFEARLQAAGRAGGRDSPP
jgi:hypothetical protein